MAGRAPLAARGLGCFGRWGHGVSGDDRFCTWPLSRRSSQTTALCRWQRDEPAKQETPRAIHPGPTAQPRPPGQVLPDLHPGWEEALERMTAACSHPCALSAAG